MFTEYDRKQQAAERVKRAAQAELAAHDQTGPDTTSITLADLSIAQLAQAIEADWGERVNYAARPYLDAMHSMARADDAYGLDDGHMVIAYFLSNARGWRGPTAKAIKAELNRRIA